MMIRTKGLAVALALAIPAAAAAQTPEQVAERYLQTFKAGDWAGNAALIHPAELDSAKAAFVDVVTSDTSTAGLRQIFQVSTPAELRALTPQQVYQRFVAGALPDEMKQFVSTATFSVIGHVEQGDTAYVVYRVSGAGQGNVPISQVTILALRKDGGQWKARLTEETRQMLAGLRMAAAQRRAANQAGAAVRPPIPPGAVPPTPPPPRP
jgi:hypothetical protein